MKRIFLPAAAAGLALAILLWAAGPVAAQQPAWNDNGQKGKTAQKADRSGPQGPGMENRGRGGPAGPADQYRQQGRQVQQPHRQEYQHRQEQRHQGMGERGNGPGDGRQRHFGNVDRSPIDRYYADQFRRGKCPPGLAKKGNGCMPPGQAKKWRLHRPLPRDVIFYDLPRDILVHLGTPPSGHRFVRVAGDILLIAVGTGMVVDAIEDLGRIY
ncbi:MAG: RcnB family protein [Desulfobacteraceae bacterium]|jgi:hypothetical protein|nr:RcnB family protein [Desulfobacteraceae bacterium]